MLSGVAMMQFKKQKMVNGESLGDQLREAREDRGIDLDRVSKETDIAFKYLEALESNNLSAIPGQLYLKSYLKVYSAYLHLNFNDIWKLAQQAYVEEIKKPRLLKSFYFLLWHKFIYRLIVGIIVLAVVVFLIFEIESIFAPPELTINYPPDQLTTSEKRLNIVGQSEPEVQLMINNTNVFVQDDGVFNFSIDLQKGINTIKIIAIKRHGRFNEIERRVLLTEEENN